MTLSKTILLAAAACLLLTACGSNTSNNFKESSEHIESNSDTSGGIGSEENLAVVETGVQSVTEGYDSDFESCKNTSYINLDWTNAAKCPVNPVSHIKNLEYDGKVHQIETIPQKERLEKFKEYCVFYFGEYLDECAFFEPYDEIPNSSKIEVSANGITYRSYYRVSEFKKEIESNSVKISWLIYRNVEKKQYLWWAQSMYPHWVNKGDALAILNENFNFTSWIPSDLGEPVARYYNDGKNDNVTYKLSNGEMSIGDAIKYFTKDYAKSLPYEVKPEYYVRYVDVYKLGDKTYAYLLMTTTMYDKIPFEQGFEMSTASNIPNFFMSNGQALMVSKNEIDTTLWCCPETEIKVVGNPVKQCVSLKEAADIVSKSLSDNVKFNVISTELIYHGRSTSLKPTWLFSLYNTNDNLYYNAYVDAESGKFDYFKYNLI